MMHLRKFILAALTGAVFSVAANGSPPALAAAVTVRIGYIQAPAAIAFIVMRDRKMLEAKGLKPLFRGFVSPGADYTTFMGGSTDIAIAGSPVPARYYNKGVPVKVFSCALMDGVYLMVPKASPVKTWADLKGLTIGVPTVATAATVLTRLFMSANGINPTTQAHLIVMPPPNDIPMADTKEIQAFVTWEPFVTKALETGRYRIGLSFSTEWEKLTHQSKPWVHGVLMVHDSFLKAHPNAVKIVRQTFFEAIAWDSAHPEQAAKMAAPELHMKPAEIVTAMSRAKLCRSFGEPQKADLIRLYKLMYKLNPQSVGGKVPGPGLYE